MSPARSQPVPASDAPGESHSRWLEFYDVVRQIPAGRVATYGQVAALAGYSRHARQVGYALFALDGDSDVPWQRVVNARGEISSRAMGGYAENRQRALLEGEGVDFSPAGRIDLSRFRWHPESEA